MIVERRRLFSSFLTVTLLTLMTFLVIIVGVFINKTCISNNSTFLLINGVFINEIFISNKSLRLCCPYWQLAPVASQGTLTIFWMHAYAYYSYPACLFGILLVGAGASSYLLYCQRLRLVSMASQRHLVPLVHQKFVRALLGKQLVPGDVIVVQRGRIICDMVLLRGTCLVEESMLSGEVWTLANPTAWNPVTCSLWVCQKLQVYSH